MYVCSLILYHKPKVLGKEIMNDRSGSCRDQLALEVSVAKSFSDLWTTSRQRWTQDLENGEQKVQQSTVFGTGEITFVEI